MTALVRSAIRNMTDLLTKEQTEILKTASLLMVPALLSKSLGYVYILLVSTQLGNGIELTDFNTANAIPEMLTNILLLGVVSAVVIPVFIDAKEHKGERGFLNVYNTLITVVMAIFLAVSVLMIFFGPQLLSLFTDLSEYPGKLDRVLAMMRFLMVPNFILGISMFISSGLNVYHRILVPQLAPVLFNIGSIFSVLFLLPLMNYNPWALVIGVFLGSILHLIIQVPLIRMLGVKYTPTLDFQDEYVRKVAKLALPRGAAFAAEQFALLFTKAVASSILLVREVGGTAVQVTAINVLTYANSLALVIPSLFGYSFAVASFPTISKLYTHQRYEEISEIIARTLNQIFFLAIPFTAAVVILRLPVVRLTFGLLPGTAFTREDSSLVAWVLLFLGLGLVFTSGKWFLYRLFYAAKDTVTPLWIALAALIVSVLSTVLMTNLFSHNTELSVSGIQFTLENFLIRGNSAAAIGGPALGITLGTIFEYFVLLIMVHKRVTRLDVSYILDGMLRKLIPTVSMIGLMYFMYKTWEYLSFPIDAEPGFQGSTTFNLILLTTLTTFTSFMVYYLLCYLFRVEELRILRRFLNPIFKLGGLHIYD